MTKRYGTGSQGLHRSGFDGSIGSKSQVAPRWSDTRMRRYTEKLNRLMGTFCRSSGGATTFRGMTYVLSFFSWRQPGNHRIQWNWWWLSFLGMYKESIAEWTRSVIREGWPVIVSTKETWVSGFHYPVVTKYRRRSRKYRRCLKIRKGIKFFCGRWKTEYDDDIVSSPGMGRIQEWVVPHEELLLHCGDVLAIQNHWASMFLSRCTGWYQQNCYL